MSLFEKWLEVETLDGVPISRVLEMLNAECGTHYKHNWVSQNRSRDKNLPIRVRRYMLSKVLPVIFEEISDEIKGLSDDDARSAISAKSVDLV